MVSKDCKSRGSKSKDSSSVKTGLGLKSHSKSSSGNANRSEASDVTLNTLSMVSTPWSTESGFTSTEWPSGSLLTWTITNTLTSNTLSTTPVTSTASRYWQSIFGNARKPMLRPDICRSFTLCLRENKSTKPMSPPMTPWTVEMLTNEGLVISNTLHSQVRPSPELNPISSSDYYPPSTDTLASRKGSRVSITPASSISEVYFPINYINHVTLHRPSEEHIGLDWKFAKENGIPIVISVPIN